MNADTRPGAHPRTPLAAAMLIASPCWTRPPIQAGRPGLATVHLSTCVPVAAHVLVQKESWKGRGGAWRSASSLHAPLRLLRHDDMGSIKRDGGPVFVLRRRWLRFEQPRVAAPWGPCPKVWPPCSFSNKEPSKTTVWLPCSRHVQEQKRLPPRLADESNHSLQGQGSRQKGGLCCVRACVCGACALMFVQALAATMPNRGRHR